MVISFIPYIEDSVLGLISQDSGLFLKNGGRPFMRQRLRIHPPSQNFTSVYLTCSLRNSRLNTLTLRGVTVYSNGPCMQGSLSRPGGEVRPMSHLTYPGQRQRIFTKQGPLMAHDSSK